MEELDEEQQTWAINSDAVQAILKFIHKRRHKGVLAIDLVNWDASHGKRLFCWDETKAAHEWRLQQARVFLNSFRGVFDRMRVRKFIHVPGNEETGRDENAYIDTTIISQDAKLRTWAIADLAKRAESILSEMRFWKLTEAERQHILVQLETAMRGDDSAAA